MRLRDKVQTYFASRQKRALSQEVLGLLIPPYPLAAGLYQQLPESAPTPACVPRTPAETAKILSLITTAMDIDFRQPSTGETALYRAARCGNIDIATRLIALGANVNAPDVWGDTPLHVCVAYGHETMARLLIRHGADLAARNEAGRAPDGAYALGAKLRHEAELRRIETIAGAAHQPVIVETAPAAALKFKHQRTPA